MNEAATKIVHDVQRDNLRSVIDNKFECPFALTTEQFELLTGIVSPRTLVMSERVSNHDHPVAAALTRYAYKCCVTEAANQRAIDVGGSPARTPAHHHLCCLIDNARDDSRYVQAAFNQVKSRRLNGYDFRQYLSYKRDQLPKPGFCVDGAEHCNYQAPYGYAVHVYDLTMTTIVELFIRHGFYVFDMWMYLPYAILDRNYVVDQDHYKVDVSSDGKTCLFTVGSSSNGYAHDAVNWLDYYEVVKIKLNDGAIVLERRECLRTFTNIRFTKTEMSSGRIYYRYEFSLYRDNTIVPDVPYYCKYGHYADNPFRWQIFTDTTFVNRALDWCQRQADGNVLYPAFASFCVSIKNNVYYQANGAIQLVYRGLDTHTDVYERLVQSLFVIGLVKRYHRTQTLSNTIKFMQNNEPGTWTTIKQFFRELLQSFRIGLSRALNGYSGDVNDDFAEQYIKENEKYIFNLHVKKFDPIIYDRILEYDCNFGSRMIYFPAQSSFTPTTITSNVVADPRTDEGVDSIVPSSDSVAVFQRIRKSGSTSSMSSAASDEFPVRHGDGAQRDGQVAINHPQRKIGNAAAAKADRDANGLDNSPVRNGSNARNRDGHAASSTPQRKSGSAAAASADMGATINPADRRPSVQVRSAPEGLGHWTVAYNPPGDGKCGIHAVNWFLQKNKIQMNIPKLTVKGKNFPDVWLDSDDINVLCRHNGVNLIAHRVENKQVVTTRYMHGFDLTLKIAIVNQHWLVVNCQCDVQDYTMGDYAQLPLRKNSLYVNAANEMLTDGAGQAAAFKQLFPGYSRNIQKPIPNVMFHLHNGYHLALVVAHNAQGENPPNYQAINDRYAEIAKALHAYALKHNLIIELPLIGTAIFRNPLCCFKHHFDGMKNVRLNFFNKSQRDAYLATKPCRHGGYEVIVDEMTRLTWSDKVYSPEIYMDILPEKNKYHMFCKYQDLLNYICDAFNKPKIVELACAPGHFAVMAKRFTVPYTGYHFANGDFELLDGVKIAGVWNNHKQLFQLMGTKLPDETMYLLDNSMDLHNCDDYIRIAQYISEHKTNRVMFCFKVALYDCLDAAYSEKINEFYKFGEVQFVRNHGSNPRSSETYVFVDMPKIGLQPDDNIDIVDALNECEIQAGYHQTVGASRLFKQGVQPTQVHVIPHCKHEYIESRMNCTLSWEPTQVGLSAYIEFIINDPLVGEKFSDELKSVLKSIKSSEYNKGGDTATLDVIGGVQGCGKTHGILKNCCAKCCIIISPVKVIAKDNQAYLDTSLTYMTAIKYLFEHKRRLKSYIYLDEIQAHNPYYVHVIKHLAPGCKIIGMGDEKQVGLPDFAACAPATKWHYYADKLLVSKRVPHAIASMFSEYEPGFRSAGGKGIVKIRPLSDIDQIEKPNCKSVLLCSTQDVKKSLLKRVNGNIDVKTIGEVVGATYAKVCVYTPDIVDIWRDRVKYVYTAMGRTSNELVLYGSDEDIELWTTILNTPVERALDAAHVVPINIDQSEVIVDVKPTVENKNKMQEASVDLDAVESVLKKVFIPANQFMPEKVVNYGLNIINENADGKNLKFDIKYVDNGKDVIVRGKKMGRGTYQREYHGKNLFQVLNTMIGRYGKRSVGIARSYKNKFVSGLEKFLRPNYRDIIKANKFDSEKVWLHTVEYLKVLQTKYPREYAAVFDEQDMALHKKMMDDATPNSGKDFLLDVINSACLDQGKPLKDLEKEFYSSSTRTVDFHMKRQPKEIRDPGFDTKDKAGQGISAWSKILNVFFSGYIRALNELFPKLLRDNVILAFGMSDAEISEKFVQYADFINSRKYKKNSADVSEFDSIQDMAGIWSSVILMMLFCVPRDVVDTYVDCRKSWVLSAKCEEEGAMIFAMLEGVWKQHSGQPATLLGNTIFDISLIGMAYEYGEIYFAAFKGDDSFTISDKLEPSMDGQQTCIKTCGVKLKTDDCDVPEFIANFVTPQGFFPDVLRRASRVVSRVYTGESDWNDMRRSVADSLAVVKNAEAMNVGIQTATIGYNLRGINLQRGDVEVLTQFLHDCVYREDLKPYGAEDYIFSTLDVKQHYDKWVDLGRRL